MKRSPAINDSDNAFVKLQFSPCNSLQFLLILLQNNQPFVCFYLHLHHKPLNID